MLNLIITLFSGTIISSGIYFFVKIDGKKIVSEKYRKWKRLNNLVSHTHKSTFMITIVSIKMFLQMYYDSVIQYLNNSVIKLDKNMFEVTYIINGKEYKMVVKPKKGPCPIADIFDEKGDSCYERIIPYLIKPNHEFNTGLYPDFFGYKQLKFEMIDGKSYIFNHSETILFC